VGTRRFREDLQRERGVSAEDSEKIVQGGERSPHLDAVLETRGDEIAVRWDGEKIEATDDTFKDAGKVGLWTKADSVTFFDDLKVTAK